MSESVQPSEPTNDPRCGSPAGYKAHRRRGERACAGCREAVHLYQLARTSPAQRAEKAKAYYEANRDTIKARSRANYENNRERASATNKAWRQRNPEAHKQHNRSWREANLEKSRLSANEWRKRNPHKAREVERRRRARIAGERYTEADVLETYGSDCHLCGSPIDLTAQRRIGRDGWEQGLHVDHLVPIVQGGADSLENVRPSHGRCNVSKGGRTA